MDFPVTDRASLLHALGEALPDRPDLIRKAGEYTKPRGWWISVHLSKWRIYVRVGAD